jgi:hypothetical protein
MNMSMVTVSPELTEVGLVGVSPSKKGAARVLPPWKVRTAARVRAQTRSKYIAVHLNDVS